MAVSKLVCSSSRGGCCKPQTAPSNLNHAPIRQAMFDDDVHALTCSRDKSFLCWDLRVKHFDTLTLPTRC